ncbi:MAG: hypothetical protein KAU38_06335 [Desulfobacterales bacterium]|nr:hypothetical protein [Desulfobacterales bacterium]
MQGSVQLTQYAEKGPGSMKQVVIENPVINSPFEEPKRHFLFSEDGITNEIQEARRISSYFVPVVKQEKKGKHK